MLVLGVFPKEQRIGEKRYKGAGPLRTEALAQTVGTDRAPVLIEPRRDSARAYSNP